MKSAILSSPVLAACALVFSLGCSDSGGGPVNGPPPPSPASISVDPSSLELLIGESGELSATVFDSAGDVLIVSVAWESLDPSVASVSSSGLVEGLAPGTATVRASAGSATADAAIMVNDPSAGPPSEIALDPASLELLTGESRVLSATVYDSAGIELQVQVAWESLNPSVASVSSSGLVEGLAPGTATVRASAGSATADATITVSAGADPGVYARCPVLFVHGSGLSSQSFDGMIQSLEQDGYPSRYLYAVDLVPNDGANRIAASQAIAPAVEGLLAEARAAAAEAGHTTLSIETICIVSHSMGAASSRWYVANIRPDRVDVWISIAGANHGTDALEGLPGEGNDEMVPAFAQSVDESSFQVELNGTTQEPADESPYGVGVDPAGTPSVAPDNQRRIAYFTIRIDPDEWIKPEDSALLAGAGGVSVDLPAGLQVMFEQTSPGNYLAHVPSNHDGLPFDPSVKSLVMALLQVADE